MSDLQSVLEEALSEKLNQVTLSNSRDVSQAAKVKVRPVLVGGELRFQETRFRGTQVFHENFRREEAALRIEGYLRELFRQGEMDWDGGRATVLVSKKGKTTVKVRRAAMSVRPESVSRDVVSPGRTESDRAGKENTGPCSDCPGEAPAGSSPAGASYARLSHNRVKHYILPEGEPVDFLILLGVQTQEGRIRRERYDKFRQINRYLEFIADILEELPRDKTLHIVDFGCGKSYLTFAMYYYLHVKEGRDLRVTGLDLKEDVIRHCNGIAEKLGYDGLHFEMGDIGAYRDGTQADMVVSLHACDVATDYALEKAVKMGASVILAVPCCQHELNRQIQCDVLRPALKYGIIKERISALLTDAVRAQILERQGYDTQILEFIDMEHTPKNLLIRAVKRRGMCASSAGKGLREMEDFLQIHPMLERLTGEEE